MIFGRGGSGGVINQVSKQAGWQTVRDAVVSVGSYGHKRAAVDVGDAVNADVAVRVNAMAEQSDSYRSGVELESKGINPTMTVRAGANTTVSLGYEHFRDDRIADRGIPSINGRPYETDVSTFFGNAELSPTAVRINAFTAYVEHGFGSGMVLRNRTRIADYDKFYQNVFAIGAVNPATGRLAIGAYHDATARTNRFNQTDLTYSLFTGSVKHKLAAGLEFGRQETDNVRRAGVFTSGSATVIATNPAYTGSVGFPTATTGNHRVANVASVYSRTTSSFLRSGSWCRVCATTVSTSTSKIAWLRITAPSK